MANYTQSAGQFIGQHYDQNIINKRKIEKAQIHILGSQTDEILDVLTLFWDDIHKILLKGNEETFDFTTTPDGRASEYLRERNRLIIPTEDGFFREFIIDEHIQNRDSLKVYSRASHVELTKNKPLSPATYEGQTVNTITDTVLNATDWQRGITNYAGVNRVKFEEHISPFKALKKIASVFDLELRFRIETVGSSVVGRYVDLVERQGQWRGREITSGKDLINARRTERTDNIVTALIGLAPEKEDGTRLKVEVVDADARQVWGRNNKHLWGIHEIDSDNKLMTVEEAEQYTRTELNKRIAASVEYEVDGADLEQVFGHDHEIIRLGDDVRIKATEYNPPLYLDARIVGIESPISDRSKKKYTLGEFIEYSEEDVNALKNYFKKLIGDKSSIVYSDTEPGDKGVTWIDTSVTPNIVKHYDKTLEAWVRATPINGDEIAETSFRKWASESGADVTNNNTANDTDNVNGRSSSNVDSDALKGAEARSFFDSSGNLDTAKLEGFIDTTKNKVQADANFYWDGGALLAIDPNDSQKILRISAQGLGISVDGGQTYDNAITGAGVVAETILAGIIYGVELQGGSITSDTTIDVGTDVSIGRNLYMLPTDDYTGIEFKDDFGNVVGSIHKKSGNVGGLTIAGGGYGLTLYSNVVYMGDQGNVEYHDADSEFIKKVSETEMCGCGGYNPYTTTGNQFCSVYVPFKTKKNYVPSDVTLTAISSSGADAHVADISEGGFWLYLTNSDTSTGYKYWRGEYTG